MFIVHWRTAMLAATEMPKLKMCFFTVVGINNFLGIHKKEHTCHPNFVDPQKKDILTIKTLWIHKKRTYWQSKFYGSTKKDILAIKILWIHKKSPYLPSKFCGSTKKCTYWQSKFYGSTKSHHYVNHNFVDPQNLGNPIPGTLLIHKTIARMYLAKFT